MAAWTGLVSPVTAVWWWWPGAGYSGGGGTGGAGTGIPGAVCSGQWPGSHRHGDRHYLLFQMCDYRGKWTRP